MKQSRAALEALAGRSNGEATSQEWDSVSMTSEESGANDQKPTMEVRASLGEFSMFVSGRVCNNWWPEESNGVRVFTALEELPEYSVLANSPISDSLDSHKPMGTPWTQEMLTSVQEQHVPIVNVDGERLLAVVRASGAKSDISLSSQHFGLGVAIGAGVFSVLSSLTLTSAVRANQRKMHSTDAFHVQIVEMLTYRFAGTFEIEDLLVGPKCRQHRFLARSYESLDTVQLPSVSTVK